MRKHKEIIHRVFEKSIRKPPTFGDSVRQAGISEYDSKAVQRQTPTTPFDKSSEWLSNLSKLAEYHNSAASYQTNLNDKNKIAMYEREIATIRSQNWIIPNSEIQGLTGYVCRRCNILAFDDVRNIGYDMTMQARHMCDEEKVKSIKMVSIRPADARNLNDTAAGIILERLNCLMPGQKYLLAVDLSKSFEIIEGLLNTEIAKLWLGIPDRYYFYSLGKDERIDWIDRSVSNIGKKTMVKDFEIKDLLRMVKSKYAIFEIPIDDIVRRILMCHDMSGLIWSG